MCLAAIRAKSVFFSGQNVSKCDQRVILKLKNLLIKCTKNKLFSEKTNVCFGVYANLVVYRVN